MYILYNARLYPQDPTTNSSTAIAIEGDQIIALGTDDELLAAAPAGSSKLNMEGKTVWPGLTDSHLHLEMYGAFLSQVDCETETKQECLRRVAQKAKETPEGEWVLGHGWNQNVWESGFGSAADLDEITPRHPVYLSDKALHSAWANSLALQLAGVNSQTQDPEGGSIQRDAQGAPTGILFENAVRLVEANIPAVSRTLLKDSLLAAQNSLLRYGITSVHDFDGVECFAALQELDIEKKLILRVCKGIPFALLDDAIALHLQTGFGNDHLWLGSVKLFADGALGPQTAAMLSPYENSSSNYGTLLLTADEVFDIGIRAVNSGMSLATHAIGDKATNQVLNGYGMLREYERQNHLPQLPHRVEHLQLMHPDDILKPRQLNITASMQPLHLTSDMVTAERYWGKRSRYGYLLNTILQTGAPLIFGSDAPVESPNPFLGIHAAVTRTRADGSPAEAGWYPKEKITLAQALTAYTQTPAETAGKSGKIGRLRSGAKADLIVLNQNPFAMPGSELNSIHPTAVMVDGQWVVEGQ
jgi:predicted amidohydrolase YtcJ